MVGIFSLLNGDPRSGFSMRCCDLLHNHSCQLAHYGFCPKPLSDVRRALFFCSLSHEGIVFVPSPSARWGERAELTLTWIWRKPQADFVIAVNKDLNPPPLPTLRLFRNTISCLAMGKISRNNMRGVNICPVALSVEDRGNKEKEKDEGQTPRHRNPQETLPDLTNSSRALLNRRIRLVQHKCCTLDPSGVFYEDRVELSGHIRAHLIPQ